MSFNLQGIKVRTLNPGAVVNTGHGWKFSIVVNGHYLYQARSYESENAAKQAMREEVAMLRRRHGLGEQK